MHAAEKSVLLMIVSVTMCHIQYHGHRHVRSDQCSVGYWYLGAEEINRKFKDGCKWHVIRKQTHGTVVGGVASWQPYRKFSLSSLAVLDPAAGYTAEYRTLVLVPDNIPHYP